MEAPNMTIRLFRMPEMTDAQRRAKHYYNDGTGFIIRLGSWFLMVAFRA